MPSGRLGAIDIAASTYTTVYTVPASKVAVFTVSICNRNTLPARIRLSLSSTTGTPSNSEFIEYETVVDAFGVLERTGIVLDATKVLTAYSDISGLSIVAFGYEE